MAPSHLPLPQHLGIGFHLKDYLKKNLTSVSESNQAELPAQEIVK